MKGEFQAEREVSIVEILKALLSKILYLILALVLGAIAGGAYGYLTSKDVKYYGTDLRFYVNPSEKEGETVDVESVYSSYGSYSVNVMRNIIGLLEEDFMAEQILDGMIQNEVDGVKDIQKKASDGVTWTPQYKSWISLISNAVTFSFKADGAIAESFIDVKISVNGDVNGGKGNKIAAAISQQLQGIDNPNYISTDPKSNKHLPGSVPEFVENNMPKPAKYNATNCILTSKLNDISLTNATYASTQMTKLALIAGAIAFVAAAAVVIILYMSDKRLNDIEVLPNNFKLPILGVVPCIDEEYLHHIDNNKGGKA